MATTKVDGGAVALGKPVIAVAVDDSERSFHALRWTLLRFFSSSGAAGSTLPFKLVVVHARPTPTSIISPSATGAPDMLSVVKADLTKISSKVIDKAKETCLAHSVRDVECEVHEGDPRIVLCQAVEKHHAEILVVGSHGYGAIKRAVLGSVSDYCAHHADCNVMIVKKPKHKN
ncbi:universal stress protein PHOS34-like isoform X1 [Zingiber officinale]|nr:universal stress protein PHOS34-like isoform X1 [Zingiber officinale]